MKNKKILLYYLLEFILTILIFSTTILLIFKLTVLNINYFKEKLESKNYYHELYLDINNDFNNYIMQSGFGEEIVDSLFIEDDIKIIINNIVDNFYQGKSIEINTDNIKQRLENNINKYLESYNIKIDNKDDVTLFVEEIINIYKNRIVLNDDFIKLSSNFYKVTAIVNKILTYLIILDIVLFIAVKLLFKKITLTIPILSTVLLLVLVYFLILDKINIQYIIFWNSYVSNVIKVIFFDLLNIIKYIIIIGFTLEIIKLILIYLKNLKSSKTN
ncbi:MAG: hypothetical protein IJ068_05270 [Bacilli bacterium]|nr:hypothetical protein [Bacilli bacterium]